MEKNNGASQNSQFSQKNTTSKEIIFNATDTLETLYSHPLCPEIIKKSLSNEVSWHKRNEYKIGNGIKWSPHYAAALYVCEAILITSEGEEYIASYMEKQAPISKIKEIKLPIDNGLKKFGEAHVRRTPSDNPIISALASLTIENNIIKHAVLALYGVWDEGVQLSKVTSSLLGKTPTEDLITSVAHEVKSEVKPKDNYLASAFYRREMAEVLTKRALLQCLSN